MLLPELQRVPEGSTFFVSLSRDGTRASYGPILSHCGLNADLRLMPPVEVVGSVRDVEGTRSLSRWQGNIRLSQIVAAIAQVASPPQHNFEEAKHQRL